MTGASGDYERFAELEQKTKHIFCTPVKHDHPLTLQIRNNSLFFFSRTGFEQLSIVSFFFFVVFRIFLLLFLHSNGDQSVSHITNNFFQHYDAKCECYCVATLSTYSENYCVSLLTVKWQKE